jgi:predicted phage-related endonuclease
MDKEIALDAYAQEALAEYVEASRLKEEADVRRVKARDVLLDLFRAHDADVGVIDGVAVCRLVRSDREIVDTARFREEQPYLYARYKKLSTAYYVREIGEKR